MPANTRKAMTTMYTHFLIGGLALLLFSSAALAHTGHEAPGALAGLLHPLTGLDHLLAMLALGMYAAQRGGASRWALPLAFVASVAAGAVLAWAGAALPAVELGIAGSVLVFGALLALGARLALPLGVALAAGFALFHGYAHGAEAPLGAGLGYGVGFLAATALLHAVGLALVALLRAPRVWRVAGVAMTLVGGAFLVGA